MALQWHDVRTEPVDKDFVPIWLLVGERVMVGWREAGRFMSAGSRELDPKAWAAIVPPKAPVQRWVEVEDG